MNPSPVNPILQMQSKLPTSSMHMAFMSHGLGMFEHSSISKVIENFFLMMQLVVFQRKQCRKNCNYRVELICIFGILELPLIGSKKLNSIFAYVNNENKYI